MWAVSIYNVAIHIGYAPGVFYNSTEVDLSKFEH